MSLALVSCGKIGHGEIKETAKPATPFGPSGIPPQLREKLPDGGTPVVPGGNAPGSGGTLQITPEEDIVFTDPDNPEANLPELSTILATAKSASPWEQSITIARQRAAREGKPLLIWFTDSKTSPMCKALSEELFNTPDFETWATEKLVRLRVDTSADFKEKGLSLGEQESRRIDVRNYAQRIKKQYKVLGHPTLLLLNPSGEVIGRYRGFKRGQADYTWGLIKHGEAVSVDAYQSWRSSLEKKGYREWKDRRERKVFAKLTSYSKGTLTLIEPDGTRCRTHENQLSDADREWINAQKQLRKLQ